MDKKEAKETLWLINELVTEMLITGQVPLGTPAGDTCERIIRMSREALQSEERVVKHSGFMA